MSDNGGYALYYILLLVLVASSLIGMRLPLGKALKMVLAWVAIFTTVSRNIAESAGMPTDGYKGIASTANGQVTVTRSRADLRLASIERPELTVHINEADGVNLLGMNFLSSLNGWRVERNYLVLQP